MKFLLIVLSLFCLNSYAALNGYWEGITNRRMEVFHGERPSQIYKGQCEYSVRITMYYLEISPLNCETPTGQKSLTTYWIKDSEIFDDQRALIGKLGESSAEIKIYQPGGTYLLIDMSRLPDGNLAFGSTMRIYNGSQSMSLNDVGIFNLR